MAWQLENGWIDSPGMETLRGLSRVLGVSIDWLVNGEGVVDEAAIRAAAARAAIADDPTSPSAAA
jgi:hypothetical protein